MDRVSSQASSRPSSRKRVRITNGSDYDSAVDEPQIEPRIFELRKRRVVEHLHTRTSVPERSVARNSSRPRSGPADCQGTSDPPPVKKRSIDIAALSHEDPVPTDCCFTCRRRGGNYAYTCLYEVGSESCKRCIKEDSKCRPATAAEIAKTEARCPQCKRRGLFNCWYEDDKASCGPCVKWKKQCGAPTKRVLNAHTRSFLRIPTPEPDQSVAVTNDQMVVNDNEYQEITGGASRCAFLPRHSSSTGPTRSRRITRQSTVWVSTPPESRAEQPLSTLEQVVFAESGEAGCHVSEHNSRRAVSPARATALSNTALVTSTPDTSALRYAAPEVHYNHLADGVDVLPVVNIMMADDGSADLQLGRKPRSGVILTTQPIADFDIWGDNTAEPLVSDGTDMITEMPNLQQRRTPAVNLQVSRPQRSQSRPSYTEFLSNDNSDQDAEEKDEMRKPEVEVTSNAGGTEDFATTLRGTANEHGDDEDIDLMDIPSEHLPKWLQKSKFNATVASKPGKGIDLTLPPLSNIHDIAADMVSRAVELGLCGVIGKLEGRPIKVATLCSGTESPLIILQLLSEALSSKNGSPLLIQHKFSAEIDTTKQAYIERNFHPPILFRDARQLGDEDAVTATTAYGAEEPIPGNVDVVVAGFSCKDLSSLNIRKKTVDDQGETGDTWRAIYNYAKQFEPGIVLLENVKSDKNVWNDVVSRWSRIGYEAAWVYCDTRNYYLPQTRERMYMIAINRGLHGKNASEAVAQWKSTLKNLQRQCSSPYEAFLTDLPISTVDHSTTSSEPDWPLCRLRYDQIRSEQRLGIGHPITRWSDNGALNPPDYANRRWYDSQSTRVYDAIDVAHLQAAQEGYDSMYKMKVWDVSQNVDRFKTGMGLVPCITPGGCDFGSNRQDALNGNQTLVLQGMPISKLHFAGETQRECQDLAGNAMSTPVIGASLISAIMHGYKAFRKGDSAGLLDETSKTETTPQNRLVRPSVMEHCPRHADPKEVQIAQLIDEAKLTSRLCACEGNQEIAKHAIKMCSECGHTACSLCASSPKHRYAGSILPQARKHTPNEFVRSWKPRLPLRLQVKEFPNLNDRIAQLQQQQDNEEACVRRIMEEDIGSQYFNLSKYVRCDNAWKIVYSCSDMRLELIIGEKTQWLLFIDCSSELPGNSKIRKALEMPIARANVEKSLLDVQWEMFIPSSQQQTLRLHGSTQRSKSWRNMLGLRDYQTETLPTHIHIRDSNGELNFLSGDYTHLPHCGTAEGSLYRRSAEPVLYMFLDPDPIGEARFDSFVFSHDCTRKQWGEFRMIVARLNPAWRPCQMADENEQCVVETMYTGSWISVSIQLAASPLAFTSSVLIPGTHLAGLPTSCTDTVTVLDMHIPERLPIQRFSDFSWALESVKAAPQLEKWQLIHTRAESGCTCSPAYPGLLWSVGNGGKARPHEDRKEAAKFERGIKTRCPVFHVLPTVSKSQTRIEIGINIASLVHRARRRLTHSTGGNEPVECTWRLLNDHVDTIPVQLPLFRLRSNTTDSPFTGSLSLVHELRGTQPRSLAWMRAQEAGISLNITEVEEAVHPGLGWRVEARAQTATEVRGGVLADLPSFGKTVTTIALIQSEFEEFLPEAILDQNRPASKNMPHLIETAATLIMCPPHIALQWQNELKHFLGTEKYDDFDVRIIRDYAELKRFAIHDLQHSRVIVVSWTVLSEDDYIAELAWLTAMPEPENSSFRAFATWMDAVSKDLPGQVFTSQNMDLSGFKRSRQDLLEKRLQHPDFQAALPVKLQHGSKYQSYQPKQAANTQPKNGRSKITQNRKPRVSRNKLVPLLHMFRFNRIVIDEYHYLNDYKKMKNMLAAISVKKVAAHKHWVLSGTPVLASFTDVDNIASFLGVKLGRFAVETSRPTPLEEFLVDDQTAVERFLSKTEVMSRHWHRARHERAQEFLDIFVRQNEASLEHISCTEELRVVDLNVAHHAIYLELSQHLISQRMQVKRLRNRADCDKSSRLNESLNNSNTAEDALLKAALFYESSEGESGLESLVQKRSGQRHEIESDISRLMRALEWHKRTDFDGLKPTDPKKEKKEENTVPKLYASFVQDITKNNWLGDSDATVNTRRLLKVAAANPTHGGLEELKEVPKEKITKEAKTIIANLRQSCIELALRIRSERFITTIQQLLQPLSKKSENLITCDAKGCQGEATVFEMYLASQCGHLTCEPCIVARGDDEDCVVPECSCTTRAANLIKVTDLDSTDETNAVGHSYGRKMDSIVHLLNMIPIDDQSLMFAPNEESVTMLCDVLDHHMVRYYTPSGCNSRQAAKVIEDFKASINKDLDERPRVLLLNLASETAAGVNLTNANHIVFVSPLLVQSQYKYDSAMTQAIARSRRYGQEKQVHIYHFAALRTIDVDILEHRYKRTNSITASGSAVYIPSKSLAMRERTKLVKNKNGSVMLVPISWLADVEVRRGLEVEEELEKFTSLINFSETFETREE